MCILVREANVAWLAIECDAECCLERRHIAEDICGGCPRGGRLASDRLERERMIVVAREAEI
jgi:hypothetical protein